MLRCKDVVAQVAGDAGARPPFRRHLGVTLHLLMCRHCRAYVRQLRQIGAAARRLYGRVTVTPDYLCRVAATVGRAAEQARPPIPPDRV